MELAQHLRHEPLHVDGALNHRRRREAIPEDPPPLERRVDTGHPAEGPNERVLVGGKSAEERRTRLGQASPNDQVRDLDRSLDVTWTGSPAHGVDEQLGLSEAHHRTPNDDLKGRERLSRSGVRRDDLQDATCGSRQFHVPRLPGNLEVVHQMSRRPVVDGNGCHVEDIRVVEAVVAVGDVQFPHGAKRAGQLRKQGLGISFGESHGRLPASGITDGTPVHLHAGRGGRQGGRRWGGTRGGGRRSGGDG
mmetsp:Transcript_28197/g.84370  ORF Transcript_28197/g.84370 Transcript_28197/m.84370 type:complete len:249 (+) Transcript_28197:1039-1785(+)